MQITRRFTREGQDPFAGLEFAPRDSRIVNPNGSVVFEARGVMAPAGWSQVAVDILAQKYFRRAGVPAKTARVAEDGVPSWLQPSRAEADDTPLGGETDARQVFHRLAGCWTYWGWTGGYFDSQRDARAFYDETCHMLAAQMAAPNSPQWFNAGLHWAYGIEGPPQGHYFVDPRTNEMRRSTSAYERPAPHACFIQAVEDDLVNEGGIMDLWVREARIFKYGSGTGSNFSALRGENEPLSGGGKSSGLMSFLKIGDRAAGAIKSGGTTRRAAKMVVLDLDHPDIEEFVNWKVTEEQKVAELVAGSRLMNKHLNAILRAIHAHPDAAGRFDPTRNDGLRQGVLAARAALIPENYIARVIQLAQQGFTSLEVEEFDTDWNSKAYYTVSGQNSNNSVRITNEFMAAVGGGGPWHLYWRTELEKAKREGRAPKPKKTLPARDLWDQIAYAAWSCADPGVQFDTTFNDWHTCPEDGRINATNPCSEYAFLDDTACNLASLNLITFYDTKTATFDIEAFRHAVRIWTLILEISVHMAQFPSQPVARKSFDFRTLGLGYANLGALLMVQGIPYDSAEGRAQCGALTALMHAGAYATSAEIAAEVGPFARYEANQPHMLRVIRNHRRAAYNAAPAEYEGCSVTPVGIDARYCPPELLAAARAESDRMLELGERHGYRNAQVTVIAPTGTIGLIMDCDTTGIEPDFALVKFKKLAGGGYFKIINQSVPPALARLGYAPWQADDIVRYTRGAATLQGCPHVNAASLKAKGFTDEVLAKVEESLPGAFELPFVFNRWTLGDGFLKETLKIPAEVVEAPGFDVLAHLGFSKRQVEEASTFVCGTMTIEGAPHLKAEHLPVFDCANKCGKLGKRFLSWES
ncbi:MAG: adenosylcobalamin-dependent ribonucleoside-diphosphate reductase, partial [Gemmataceae bacterium]|nr:adenosylcobalamin-dependent ribonucleoside-diphosphate reductase [Gemmataceae bacterium]